MIPILNEERKHREVMWFAPGHTEGTWLDLSLCLSQYAVNIVQPPFSLRVSYMAKSAEERAGPCVTGT